MRLPRSLNALLREKDPSSHGRMQFQFPNLFDYSYYLAILKEDMVGQSRRIERLTETQAKDQPTLVW